MTGNRGIVFAGTDKMETGRIYAELDIFLRGGACVLLGLLAIAFAARRPAGRKSISMAALALGMIAYLLVSSPNLPFSEGPVARGLVMVAGLGPVLVYWAGAELFLDRFEIRPWHLGGAVLVTLGAWLAPVSPLVAQGRGVLVIALYLHLLVIVLRTRPGDLVEQRRRFRRWFLTAMALLGSGIGIVEILNLDADLPDAVFALQAAVFLGLAAVFLLWTMRIEGDLWVATTPKPAETPKPVLSVADRAVLERLDAAMTDGIWQKEGLSIGALAAAIDAPDHRVRRVINQGKGFRNFASFINAYRIDAAKAALCDPRQADTTVLSIAYDVGFASLGPFNRAFRDLTGQSPTEFRAAQTAQNGKKTT